MKSVSFFRALKIGQIQMKTPKQSGSLQYHIPYYSTWHHCGSCCGKLTCGQIMWTGHKTNQLNPSCLAGTGWGRFEDSPHALMKEPDKAHACPTRQHICPSCLAHTDEGQFLLPLKNTDEGRFYSARYRLDGVCLVDEVQTNRFASQTWRKTSFLNKFGFETRILSSKKSQFPKRKFFGGYFSLPIK